MTSRKTATEREEMWLSFLQRWPLERLDAMPLTDYTEAGSQDAFQIWLEKHTEPLGSIWGGSAFKFGIYSRDNKVAKENGGGKTYTTEYAWYSKYGDTAEAVWQKVRSTIAAIAKAARVGDWQVVEQADLGTVVKWKIAFLYQNREHPSILPMYSPERLQWLSGQSGKLSQSELQKTLMAQRGAQGLFDYVDALQQRWETHAGSQLTGEQALAWMRGHDGLQLLNAVDSKPRVAAFRGEDGQELALTLDNKTPVLYVSDGAWLGDAVRTQLEQWKIAVRVYQPQESRSSSLQAHTPTLGVGYPIVHLKLTTLQALEFVCGSYLAATSAEQSKEMPVSLPTVALACPSAPLNQILYGPPGTGKTYATVSKALEILDPQWLAELKQQTLDDSVQRLQMKQRFDTLHKQGRVTFTTFHQSFSYEDFVEGIRAVSDEQTQQLSYPVVDGVFKSMCEVASVTTIQPSAAPIELGQRQVWKMSLGNTLGDEAGIFEECIQGGYVLLGYGKDIDFTGSKSKQEVAEKYLAAGQSVAGGDYSVTSVATFILKLKVGDLVVVSDGNYKFRAIGEITSEYEYAGEHVEYEGYAQRRRVNWLRQYSPSLPYTELLERTFSQMTLYALKAPNLVRDKLQRLLRATPKDKSAASLPSGQTSISKAVNEARVLVIDEINRGNVSRIFGELITLLEPSKRAGASEALSVTLPYSKKEFSVPSNVYIIGTMNTTDRSLAGLDVALRRRFEFEELMPNPEVLVGVVVEDEGLEVDVSELLRVMNERIEALLDREHQLGHAYFMELREDASRARLAQVFKNRVIPLLQEYFFDDWERIAWVLNDHRKPEALRFVQKHGKGLEALFGANHGVQAVDKRWCLNHKAFDSIGSFAGVIDAGWVTKSIVVNSSEQGATPVESTN